MSNVNLVSSGAPMGGVISATATPTATPEAAEVTPPPANAGAGAGAVPPRGGPGGPPPSAGEATNRPRPVVRPPSFNRPPAGGNGEAKPPARPRVRLPGAGNETSLLSGSKRAEFASVDGRVIRGGPTPPPLMPGDTALVGGGASSGNDVSTGVELVPDAIDGETPLVAVAPPTTVPVDSGSDATGPQMSRPFDSISQNVIVGEAWDASSPGADGTPTSIVPVTLTPSIETN